MAWINVVWHGIGVLKYCIVRHNLVRYGMIWHGVGMELCGMSDTGEGQLNSQLQAGWMSRRPTKIFLSN